MSNLNSNDINQARAVLEGSKSVLIAMPDNPSIDTVACGLSFYLSLSSVGKQVFIASPMQMTVKYNNLIGVGKISSSQPKDSGRNLVISFPYQEGSIEKVSYNIENETFNLVIEPRENYPAVTQELINFSYSGGMIDTIIIVGAQNLESLTHLYNANKSLFSEKNLINFDNQSNNSLFGKINIVDPSASSVCEMLTGFLSNIGLSLNPDISTNLLSGLADATQNYTSDTTNANTFETASILLKNGANKSISPSQNTPQIQNTAEKIPMFKQSQPKAFSPSFGKTQKPAFSRPSFHAQQGNPPSKPKNIMSQNISSPPKHEATHPETPPDWLKPKIYKGSTLL